MAGKPLRIQFVYEHKYPDLWKDGLWAALEVLKQEFTIDKLNLAFDNAVDTTYDFYLGWGGFNSPADKFLQEKIKGKKGLCIAGNAFSPINPSSYGVLFYETEWYRPQIESHRNIIQAFGVNTDIYWQTAIHSPKIWDYVTVGAFANWKRQLLLLKKTGYRFAIGEIQKDNMDESGSIVGRLVHGGVSVSDMVDPTTLAKIYHAAKVVYVPADINGGGERAVMEAKACGAAVEVEDDNPKLMEIALGPVRDHYYYAAQLKRGILSCV